MEKKSCYENFSKYLEDLEKFKKKMSPRNRENKRFEIIKNPEYKNHIAHRKSGVGYTDNLIEYINWNINSFEAWKMLPIRIIDRTNGNELILSERKNWRVVVSKWLNKDIEDDKMVELNEINEAFNEWIEAFKRALEQNKEIAKKVVAWLKSDECKELIKEMEKEAQANESN